MSLSSKTSIGRRDKKILIQRPVVVDGDANSDLVDHYEDVCNPWASVSENLSHGYEQVEANRQTGEQTVFFNIRYRGDIDRRMRVVYGARAYQIVGLFENDRKRELSIKAELVDEDIT